MEGRSECTGDLLVACAVGKFDAETRDLGNLARVRPGRNGLLLQEPPECDLDLPTESISVRGLSPDSVEHDIPYVYRHAPHRFTFA
ncbi:MAG: hypothetical protein ACRDGN_01335 [bacterium]